MTGLRRRNSSRSGIVSGGDTNGVKKTKRQASHTSPSSRARQWLFVIELEPSSIQVGLDQQRPHSLPAEVADIYLKKMS